MNTDGGVFIEGGALFILELFLEGKIECFKLRFLAANSYSSVENPFDVWQSICRCSHLIWCSNPLRFGCKIMQALRRVCRMTFLHKVFQGNNWSAKWFQEGDTTEGLAPSLLSEQVTREDKNRQNWTKYSYLLVYFYYKPSVITRFSSCLYLYGNFSIGGFLFWWFWKNENFMIR